VTDGRRYSPKLMYLLIIGATNRQGPVGFPCGRRVARIFRPTLARIMSTATLESWCNVNRLGCTYTDIQTEMNCQVKLWLFTMEVPHDY